MKLSPVKQAAKVSWVGEAPGTNCVIALFSLPIP